MTSNPTPSSMPPGTARQWPWAKAAIILILAMFMAVVVLPQYLTSQWPWQNPPEIPHLKTLRQLRQTGLAVAEWQQQSQQVVTFGGDEWSYQQFATPLTSPTDSTALPLVLLIRPQVDRKDQPEVEWLNLKGAQKWKIDSKQSLAIAPQTPNSPWQSTTVTFARAWNKDQTYALAQWYAWPQGGHASPSNWFWHDQAAQWQQHQNLPWAAVTLLLPLAPLDDIAPYQPQIETAVELVQTALNTRIFNTPEA
jgi:cyanoexosortase B-associated protein